MTRAFIGLGSNQGDPRKYLEHALSMLGQLPQSALIRCSPQYWTPPVGDPEQAEFLNAVAELETALEPLDLLRRMQQIEDNLGRTRDPDRRWGPRTIDLDLLLFGHAVIRYPDLIVPHPRMARRAFVLKPLAELVPELEVPGLARVAELLADVDTRGVRPVTPEASNKGT